MCELFSFEEVAEKNLTDLIHPPFHIISSVVIHCCFPSIIIAKSRSILSFGI